jgi:hypothetical protein
LEGGLQTGRLGFLKELVSIQSMSLTDRKNSRCPTCDSGAYLVIDFDCIRFAILKTLHRAPARFAAVRAIAPGSL